MKRETNFVFGLYFFIISFTFKKVIGDRCNWLFLFQTKTINNNKKLQKMNKKMVKKTFETKQWSEKRCSLIM